MKKIKKFSEALEERNEMFRKNPDKRKDLMLKIGRLMIDIKKINK